MNGFDSIFPLAASRLRLWFENPNMAAVLLAEIAVVAMGLEREFRKGQWTILARGVKFVAGVAVLLTASRGGLIALFAGAFVMGAGVRDRSRRAMILGLTAVLALVAALSLPRFRAFATDRSVLNRLDVWRSVPQMMRDAPEGWGSGEAGLAYMNWYQPLARTERYRTLVSGHFTALVERGEAGRVTYLLAILAILWIGGEYLRKGGRPLPLALWTVFGVSACFSTTTEEKMLWALPLAGTCVWSGFVRREWRRLGVFVVLAGMIAFALVKGIEGIRLSSPSSDGLRIRSPRSGVVIVGDGPVACWLVADPAVLGGSDYPRAFRGALSSLPATAAWGVTECLARVPDQVETLVLSGERAEVVMDAGVLARFENLAEVRLISPTFDVTRRQVAVRSGVKTRTLYGEFASECPVADAQDVKVAWGAGRYVPSWAKFALTED